MRTSETVGAIFEALSKAQSAVQPVHKNAKAYNYKYAPLDAVMNSARDAISENGLAVFQGVTMTDGGWFCVTRLTHFALLIVRQISPQLFLMSSCFSPFSLRHLRVTHSRFMV